MALNGAKVAVKGTMTAQGCAARHFQTDEVVHHLCSRRITVQMRQISQGRMLQSQSTTVLIGFAAGSAVVSFIDGFVIEIVAEDQDLRKGRPSKDKTFAAFIEQ